MTLWKRQTEGQDDNARQNHLQWVQEINDNGVNLSVWEIDFVESVETQLKAGRYLSVKQAEILERIYAEKTP